MAQCIEISSRHLHLIHINQDYPCPICHDTVAAAPENNRWYYHIDRQKLGEKHPIHRTELCMFWVKTYGKCPVCQERVDVSTLIPFKVPFRQRVYDTTKDVVTDLATRSAKFFIPSFIVASIAEVFSSIVLKTPEAAVSNYVMKAALRIFADPVVNLGYLIFANILEPAPLSKVISVAIPIFTVALNYDYLIFLDTKGLVGACVGTGMVCGIYYSMRFGGRLVNCIDRLMDRLPAINGVANPNHLPVGQV